ncbi:MAG: phenylalanine--tRNA ligase subunit beta [Dehalococcoidales bacterium]|nr:phenylalanine--tRNA ligase subunit beta [Dehalococcoidales bacterium]
MKVPIKWLKDYIDISLSPKELAHRLTMAGTETGLKYIGESWEGVVIGQIASIDPHPNADRLRLATVDTGTGRQTVVCGAPNLQIGDKIVFADVGANLTDGHTGEKSILKPAKIRGVESCGMVCSEMELGISKNHEGIIVLPPEAPLGKPLAEFLSDIVLDIEVTPNRPDLLSVIGVAWEVAALTDNKVNIPPSTYEETGDSIEKHISIEIVDSDLCPRYCASLITGIKIGESPEWLKQRLIACGLRPISNIVDVTNYVMFEYGQPLHSFDYDKIKTRKIVVRRAGNGEIMQTLDDVERKLSDKTLVITDGEKAVAIAGVMGGANSEITENTTSILLESANFNAASIHYTSHGLKLISEASMRFERGIRPDLTIPAVKRATQLILQLAGGKAAKGIMDIYPQKKELKAIRLHSSEIERILGIEFGMEQVEETLTSLGFKVAVFPQDKEFLVTPAYWRSDINIEIDLVEEVARIIGYENIPTTLLSGAIAHQEPNQLMTLKSKIKQNFVGFGFQEIITYSLTSREMLEKAFASGSLDREPVKLSNAMSSDQEYLRTNLRSGLLSVLESNLRHEEGPIRLFELSRIYLPRDNDLPEEQEILCGLMHNPEEEKAWPVHTPPFDFFTVKGVVEIIMASLGVKSDFRESNDDGLRPGRQAEIIVTGKKMGVIGELHPKVAIAFDISDIVYLFEINVTGLLPSTLQRNGYHAIARFPSVVRDIALVLDINVTHQQIVDIISKFTLVNEITLFDVYSGKQVSPGKKSLAYRLNFQSAEHTLTDIEVDKVFEQILIRLKDKLGATLRA